jgi:hypothetical protein
MQHTRIWLATVIASGIAITSSALAQDMFAYPPAGRAQAQQQQDQFECHQWAVEQTHFDPVQYAAQTAAAQDSVPPKPQQAGPNGGQPRPHLGVAGGAAQGAAVAHISGGNAGQGAAAGAVLRAIQGKMGARAAEEQRQREAQAAKQAQLQQSQSQQFQQQQELLAKRKAYQRARATCFKARGYTVSES